MYADQVQAAENSGRNRRVLSIEELRKRLGVAAPVEDAAKPAKTNAEVRTPPRIVRRKELIAAY
jgi:hypothetical protein